MIVIVGAGPTGLALALELARRSVPLRILDKSPQASTLDRATVLHPLTLEMLDRAGLVTGFLQSGVRMRRALQYNESKLISEMPMDTGDSRFRFELAISQASVERVLRERLQELGTQVEWGTEIVTLDQTPEKVILNNQIEADWVVGCDGYHSTVRRLLEVPFEGDDYPGTWAVLEAHIEGLPFQPDEVAIMAGKRCLWVSPLPSGRRRIIWLSTGDEPKIPTAEQALDVLKEHLPDHVLTLTDLSDQARFVAHNRGAQKLLHGRCLLAGDAAHAMSPAAGQGMNVGIHDAFNLGWKLARVHHKTSSASLLATYEPERRPCIETAAAYSDDSHTNLSLTGSASFRRDELWRLVSSLPAMQAWALNGNMELRMDFPDSPITLGLPAQRARPGHAQWAGPAPGERVPDEGPLYAEDGTPTSLHCLMRHTGHTYLLLLGNAGEEDFPEWFTQGQVLTSSHDPGLYVHRRLGVLRDTLLVIRPDGYLGLRAENPSPEALKQYESLLL